MTISIPESAALVLQRLHQAGFPAYIVGGCVRDSLLGRTPEDWDITTAALPEQVHEVLSGLSVLDTGLSHGTVTVLAGNHRLEVTTFRVDGSYTDHRRPDSVRFTADLREDLARRDFTVNAMAYTPEEGLQDFFGGQEDLQHGILRAVGDAHQRFQEDVLRILRGLRFCAVLGFSMEEHTAAAALIQRHLLQHIAPERIQTELCRLLTAEYAVPVLRQYRDIFAVFLPELAPMFDFDQHNRHHIYDVWEHTLHAMAATPNDLTLRLTMLLHDSGKPGCFSRDEKGVGHFYGHAAASAQIARQVLTRLRLEQGLADRVVRLIQLHDSDLLPTEKSLLRWLRRIGEPEFRLLLAVKRADNRGQSPKDDRSGQYDRAEQLLNALMSRKPCFSRAQLTVKGGDILHECGLSGAAVGQALDWLVEQVISGTVPNHRDALLASLSGQRF